MLEVVLVRELETDFVRIAEIVDDLDVVVVLLTEAVKVDRRELVGVLVELEDREDVREEEEDCVAIADALELLVTKALLVDVLVEVGVIVSNVATSAKFLRGILFNKK